MRRSHRAFFTLAFSIGITLTLVGCAASPTKPNAPDLLSQADYLYRSGALVEAEHHYRTIVQQAPRLSLAWYRLGNIYVRTQQFDAAIAAFEQAVRYQPQEEQYWINLTYTRVKQAQQTALNGLQVIPSSAALQQFLTNTSFDSVVAHATY